MMIKAATSVGAPMSIPDRTFQILGLQAPQFAQDCLAVLLRDYRFRTVIDIGSGAGEHARVFKAFGKVVTAVDFGRSVYARRDPAGHSYREGDFNQMDFDAQFDCAWCSHVLEHQLDAHRFLCKLHDVLREGGTLALTVPPAKSMVVGGHVSLWTPGLLIYRLVLAGFDCSQIRVHCYGYNISILLEKRSITLPELDWDCGDIRRLRHFLPQALQYSSNQLDDPYEGEFSSLNW